MNTIKLNNVEFEIVGYSRSTYFSGDKMTSTANCVFREADANTINNLLGTEITSLQIYYNDTLIYDLQNISAKLDTINEYLNVEHMDISVNLTFDME